MLQGRARCDLNLSGNEIDAGDLFCNGVLDLDSGVDFNEVVAVLLVDQELSGTGIAVVHRLGQSDGIIQNVVTDIGWKVFGGCNLNHFLVTTLNTAVTLEEMDHVSVVVTEQLHFDMLWFIQETLDEDGAVSEGRLGLGSGTFKGVLERLLIPDDTHSAATTAESGLDDDGEAIGVRERLDLLESRDGVRGSGDDRDLAVDREPASRDLVSQGGDGLVCGANPDQAVLLDLSGEIGIFGQETVTGMNEVDIVLEGDLDDLVTGQVRTDGSVLPSLSDNVGFIGLLAMHAEAILVAVDGDSLEGQLVGSPEDTDRDLTAVRDEDFSQLHDG